MVEVINYYGIQMELLIYQHRGDKWNKSSLVTDLILYLDLA